MLRLWQAMVTPVEKGRRAPESVYLAICKLAVATGARQGELIALRWDDLNLTDGVLRITKQYNQVDGVIQPKDNEERLVYLTPDGVDVFGWWLRECGAKSDGLIFEAPARAATSTTTTSAASSRPRRTTRASRRSTRTAASSDRSIPSAAPTPGRCSRPGITPVGAGEPRPRQLGVDRERVRKMVDGRDARRSARHARVGRNCRRNGVGRPTRIACGPVAASSHPASPHNAGGETDLRPAGVRHYSRTFLEGPLPSLHARPAFSEWRSRQLATTDETRPRVIASLRERR